MSLMVSQATDPGRCVVVEACAGSGKTWMLVTRIFRLLMAGASPDSVLAITFTRKAAQEMSQRLEELLEQCVLLPDEPLLRLLSERCCAVPQGGLEQVRQVALSVFRARRGVEINTFHGWFTSLCQMAPAVMGFSRQAEPSDLDAYWLDEAWAQWMRELESPQGDADTLQRFGQLVREAGGARTRSMFMALARQRAAWRIMRQAQKDEGLLQGLADDFQVDVLRTAQTDFFQSVHVQAHVSLFVRLQCMDTAAKQAKALEVQRAFEAANLQDFVDALRTQKGTPRAFGFTKGLLGKLSQADVDAFNTALESLQGELDDLLSALTDLKWHHFSSLALGLLPAFLDHLERVKAQADVIDFEDLEITAADIMANEQASAWVQLRLDRRTRHVLLDEFQDTNPLQWLILRNWLTASGKNEGQTVFMVGDPKQSIYRFRRAEARLFAYVRDWMMENLDALLLRTDQSRRCSLGVLAAVNAAFAGETAPRRGRTAFEPHTGLHDAPGSGLQVFPLLGGQDSDEAVQRVDWMTAPRGGPLRVTGDGAVEAQHVAATLLKWKRDGQIARWDNVMVLVRRHQDATPLGQALQALGIPHSVNDKSGRFSSLVWADSMALLRVLLSELNEASVLHLLRSPFFNLPPAEIETWLQALPQTDGTPGLRLWQAADQAGQSVRSALQSISRWRHLAATLPLHEVLERIFRETDIEAATLAAAPERERELAQRHWAWMLDWALDLNKGRTPHPVRALQEAARLSEHGSGAAAQDSDLDAVRILTIHSAKGLEADIVWLLNANRAAGAERANEMHTLLNWPVGEDVPLHLSLYEGPSSRGRARAAHFAQEDMAAADEADHLLYVAMTRARHRICVSGGVSARAAQDDDGVTAGSWYDILSRLPVACSVQWEIGGADSATALAAAPAVANAVSHSAATTTASSIRWLALPALAPAVNPIGEVRLPDDSLATLRGKAWHACLQHITPTYFSAFSQWWRAVNAQTDCEQALCELDDDCLREVRDRLQAMAANEALAPWLNPLGVDAGFNEFEWMDEAGRLHRADRIVRKAGQWTVIDYKWSWSEAELADYSAQLRRYALALNQTLASGAGGVIAGVLIASTGQTLHFPDLLAVGA